MTDRYEAGSTLITSQLPIDTWHDVIGEPTFADAILDRLVHNAYLKQTDLPRTNIQMGQLSQLLEQGADGLFDRLLDAGIHRVAERNMGGESQLR